MRDQLDLNELYPLMADVIAAGGTFRFYPRGISMQPLLYAGRDSVELGEAKDIKVGDAVFYRRDDGQFVLHRIVGFYGGLYSMVGDNQGIGVEFGIRPDQILAKLVGYYKGEEYHSVDEKEYKKYVRKRLRGLPFWYTNKKVNTFLRGIKHKIFK